MPKLPFYLSMVAASLFACKKSTTPDLSQAKSGSESARVIDAGGGQEFTISACTASEGQGNPWECQAKDGTKLSCIKKVCNGSKCDYTADNVCYQGQDSEQVGQVEDGNQEQPTTGDAGLPGGKADWGFLFVSDIHAGRDPNIQNAVRDGMEKIAAAEGVFKLIVTGGDNSNHGLTSGFYQQWIASVYGGNRAPTLGNMPIHAVLGNHDYCGEDPKALLTAQVNASRWKLDDLVWSHEETIGATGLKIGFVHVDTSVLAYYPNLESWLEESCSNMRTYFRNFEVNRGGSGKLIDHILSKADVALAGFANHDFLFVVGHHPVGGGACGSENKTSALGDLVKKYKASAYLAGHVHAMDFGKDDQANTLYMAMGASGTASGRPCTTNDSRKWVHQGNGFGALRLYNKTMYMTFYDEKGQPLLTKSVGSRMN